MELFRILSESGAQSRFDVAVSAQLTPLVGREQELGLLLDRWEQVEEGLGQVVWVSGEAGIGKSRLLKAMNDRLAVRPHPARVPMFALPSEQPFAPGHRLPPILAGVPQRRRPSRETTKAGMKRCLCWPVCCRCLWKISIRR